MKKIGYYLWLFLDKKKDKLILKKNKLKYKFLYKIWKHYQKQYKNTIILGKPPYTVLFLCPDTEVFSLLNVYKLLEKNPLFKPIVGVFPYEHTDAKIKFDPTKMDRVINYCQKNNLNYKVLYDESKNELLPISTLGETPFVFFNVTMGLSAMPVFWEQIPHSVKLHVPYGYFLSNSNEYIFNSVYSNGFTHQFWETQYAVELSKIYADNKGSNSVFLGYPKLDPFFDGHKQEQCWKSQSNEKKKIIWAPHHSIEIDENRFGYSCFMELADLMLELAKKYENEVQFAFRPHPLLKARLKADSRWGEEKTERYYEAWEKLSNGQLSNCDYVDLFLQADAIIGDSISFMCEFTALGKPYLFTVRDESIKNKFNESGKIIFDLLYKSFVTCSPPPYSHGRFRVV